MCPENYLLNGDAVVWCAQHLYLDFNLPEIRNQCKSDLCSFRLIVWLESGDVTSADPHALKPKT